MATVDWSQFGQQQPSGADRFLQYMEQLRGIQQKQRQAKEDTIKLSQMQAKQKAMNDLALQLQPQTISTPEIPTAPGFMPNIPAQTVTVQPSDEQIGNALMQAAAKSGDPALMERYLNHRQTMEAKKTQLQADNDRKKQYDIMRSAKTTPAQKRSINAALTMQGKQPVWNEAEIAAEETANKAEVVWQDGNDVIVSVGGKPVKFSKKDPTMQNQIAGLDIPMEEKIKLYQQILPGYAPHFIPNLNNPGFAYPQTGAFVPSPNAVPNPMITPEINQNNGQIYGYDRRTNSVAPARINNLPPGSVEIPNAPAMPSAQPGAFQPPTPGQLPPPPPPAPVAPVASDSLGLAPSAPGLPPVGGAPTAPAQEPDFRKPTKQGANQDMNIYLKVRKQFSDWKNKSDLGKAFTSVAINYNQALNAIDKMLDPNVSEGVFAHSYQALQQSAQKIILPNQALREYNLRLYNEGLPIVQKIEQYLGLQLGEHRPLQKNQLREMRQIITTHANDVRKLFVNAAESELGALPPEFPHRDLLENYMAVADMDADKLPEPNATANASGTPAITPTASGTLDMTPAAIMKRVNDRLGGKK